MKKKRRLRTLIPILSILVLLLGIIIYKGLNTRFDMSETYSIYIRNGNTGDGMEVKDKSDINKITDYMDNLHYIYMPSFARGGTCYSLSFFDDKNKELKHFAFSDNDVGIDGVHYKVINGNNITLEELLQSLSNSKFEPDE